MHHYIRTPDYAGTVLENHARVADQSLRGVHRGRLSSRYRRCCTSTELTATNPQGPGRNAHCAGYWLAQEVAAPTAKVAEPSAGLSMGLSAEQRSQAGGKPACSGTTTVCYRQLQSRCSVCVTEWMCRCSLVGRTISRWTCKSGIIALLTRANRHGTTHQTSVQGQQVLLVARGELDLSNTGWSPPKLACLCLIEYLPRTWRVWRSKL